MRFTVIGAGAWGTAFALHLHRVGQQATLVPRRAEQAQAIAASRENTDYLPGVSLPADLIVTSDLTAALAEADAVLLACPSQSLRETSARVRAALPAKPRLQLILSLAKGLEIGTHLRPSQVIAAVLPEFAVGTITGPTNAGEVARGMPSAMVLAAPAITAEVQAVQTALSGPSLRVYTSDDVAGVELGGCLKNIYAIAAGCVDGLKLGDNAKAALLTRALSEMVRVGSALGAKPDAFFGLSGFGDLAATCYGAWSRNRQFGQQIGEGRAIADLMSHRRTVVEGYKTTEALHGLCVEKGLDAPILREMHGILYEGKPPARALNALMTRGLKRE